MRESRDQLSRICVLTPFATFAFAVVYVGLWNIRQLVKISPSGSQSPDSNVFLCFIFDQKSCSFKMSSMYVVAG